MKNLEMIELLETKIQRLIEELNQINKDAEKTDSHSEYKFLVQRFIWKRRILKDTESRLAKLF